ncbi:MAG TPA: extradiol ring-cleavage dioxygenase [Dehalococcoidia bacterium]|nr:extradiol ring-cleavage dioxygenase [Dehalococcoidia bacterium]
MGEILGIGMTHYPGLNGPDNNFTAPLRFVLGNEAVPENLKDPANWPEPMRREWGDDQGTTAGRQHREALVAELRKVRQAIDDFKPDFIIVWGDDQYENFKDEIIPAFCVLAYDSVELQPWAKSTVTGSAFWGEWKNTWNEPPEKKFVMKGHRAGAKYAASSLLEQGFDIAYAYRPLHKNLGHAFLNTFLFLDYGRKGFDYPIVPFAVNCYGRRVVAQHGSLISISDSSEAEMDPPSPMPWRCFDLGRTVARALTESPWRTVLIGSSSWSHGTLTAKNWYLHPDAERDHEMFESLKAGDFEKWRQTPLAALEESGQQEMLNWMCMVGAMAELGRKPDDAVFIESWVCNSNKCFAYFKP